MLVAQLAELLLPTPELGGSNPVVTKFLFGPRKEKSEVATSGPDPSLVFTVGL